jgi:DNA-binding NarL/FixJ family response regulator
VSETADQPPGGDEPGLPRLLIVDDHELLAGTLELALRQYGLEVHVADESLPAAGIVGLARGLAPVLVLLDLELGPRLGSGLDLVAPLVDAGARVVMVTGITDRVRLAACVEAGATGVVSKATGFSVLVDTVRRVARGSPLLSDDERRSLLDELHRHRRADRERLAPFRTLSPREQEVLVHLMAGESAETIADRTYVSLATVRSHIRSILLKLGVNSQLAAVALVRDTGWSPPER